jgi:hypothetical protein
MFNIDRSCFSVNCRARGFFSVWAPFSSAALFFTAAFPVLGFAVFRAAFVVAVFFVAMFLRELPRRTKD